MTRDHNDHPRPPPGHSRELLGLIESLSCRHSGWQVFCDFVEAAAISISNAVDLPQRQGREQRYLELARRYQPDEFAKFPQMLAALVLALEEEPGDILGRAFHELGLHNKWAGQFFTPDPVCRLMAKMTLTDRESIEALIRERGFIRAQEPACGSGAMVIALAQELRESGVNYQQHLHVTAVDVDAKCVHMSYLQLSLLHVPAVIVHGNSLSLEEHAHWFTPAHVLGGWSARLGNRAPPNPPEVPEHPVPEPARNNKPVQLTLFERQ